MSEKKILTLQHPFIEGLKNVPQNRTKELKKIRMWMDAQPHLPYISDEYLYLFLHACFYHHDKTKHTIETYFTVRANTPTLFANRDVYNDKLQLMIKMAHMARLPKTTPEGYQVLMYVVKEADPAQFHFNDAVKGFCMYNDCILSEDGLAEGYVVIFDMQYVKLGHLARVSLPALRAFMVYIQEAHPARLKGVHVIHTASWINHIMRIVQPMIRSEIVSLLKFHRGPQPEGIPRDIMPRDYGGDAPPMEELGKQLFDIINKYDDWLKESEYFVADEAKRVKKNPWWSIFNGSSGNENPNNLGFNSEPASLKNLEID